MKANKITDKTKDEAWEVIAVIRDQAPRDVNDADTADIVDALAERGLLREG
ncbi:hypothetical protein [Saccharopolyspora shandongensis]|uniref:hypothetical protein n=1 Tax=Saccharopolyspora shandongensis TaxID=418495 RepID=UPI0033CAEC2A